MAIFHQNLIKEFLSLLECRQVLIRFLLFRILPIDQVTLGRNHRVQRIRVQFLTVLVALVVHDSQPFEQHFHRLQLVVELVLLVQRHRCALRCTVGRLKVLQKLKAFLNPRNQFLYRFLSYKNILRPRHIAVHINNFLINSLYRPYNDTYRSGTEKRD